MGLSGDEIRLREWGALPYADPVAVLRELRRIELEPTLLELPERVRRLRTGALKETREARMAALFAVGMSEVLGTPVLLAASEATDHDFVTAWRLEETLHYTPVQLKELPPADVNPAAILDDVARSARKYAPTDTILLVHLNRREKVRLESLELGNLPFSEVWYIWCASPDHDTWCLWSRGIVERGPVSFGYPR